MLAALRLVLLAGALTALAGQASAKRIYEGREAVALRCANTVALTAVAMAGAGMIEAAEKDVMLGVSLSILERHVSGSWAEKKAAMRIMRDRRSAIETIEDYRRTAAWCLVEFP